MAKDYRWVKIQRIKNRKREKKVATRVSRVGETIQANCGMMMTIIEDFGYSNLTIQFADGIIVYKKDYHNFLLGKIGRPRNSHLGEETMMNCGCKAKIVRYKNTHDMDVLFDDGFLKTGCNYHNFVRGKINNPNSHARYSFSFKESIFLYYLSPLGFQKHSPEYFSKFSDTWGKKEIDMFNEELKLGIEYDGWYWHRERKIDDENKDLFCYDLGISLIRLRESYRGKRLPNLSSGVSYCIDVDGQGFVDVERAIRDIVLHINTYYGKNFVVDVDVFRDLDDIKKFYASFIKHRQSSRVGETIIANNGQKMTIIEYYSSMDITVRFEDGVVVYNKRYERFCLGKIGNPNIKRVCHKNNKSA